MSARNTLGLVWAVATYGQSISIINPKAGSTLSGEVELRVATSSIPNLASVEYVLNSFRRLGIVRIPPYGLKVGTAGLLDQTAAIKAVARDIFGNSLAESEVSVRLDNFGTTATRTSPGDPIGTLSGAITWAGTWNVDGTWVCTVDGVEVQSGGHRPWSFNYDTTRVPNGRHFFNCLHRRNSDSKDTTVQQWVATVNNGAADMEVRGNAGWLVMTPGENYQLSAIMAKTNGTTGPASSPAWMSDAPGVAAVTSPGGLVTAIANGKAKIMLTSGTKTSAVTVFVRTVKGVPHWGRDGSVLTGYDPNNSFFRTSMFGLAPGAINSEPGLPAHVKKLKLTAIEDITPVSPYGYASQAAWQAAQDANITALQNAISAVGQTPALKAIIRSESVTQTSQNFNHIVNGPPALWNPHPLYYIFNRLKNVLGIAHWNDARDEGDQGWGVNPLPKARFGDGSCTSLVVDGAGEGTFTCPGIKCAGAASTMIVRNATTGGLNGTWAVTQGMSCDEFGNTTGVYKMSKAGAPAGIYNNSTDPGLEVRIWGTYGVYAGDPLLHNDQFALYNSQLRNAGIAIAWPTLAAASNLTHRLWQGDPAMADYNSIFTAYGTSLVTTLTPSYPWGAALHDTKVTIDRKLVNDWALWQNEKPKTLSQGLGAAGFRMRGRPVAISSISGRTVTTSVAHQLTYEQRNRSLIQNNSDANANTQWYVGMLTGANTFEIYDNDGPSPACNIGANGGTVTVRGQTFSVLDLSGEQVQISGGAFPSGLIPGEHITIAGSNDSCWNRTWAYHFSYTSTNAAVRPFPAGLGGTGGTINVVSWNTYNAAYDERAGADVRVESAVTHSLYAASTGMLAGIRFYTYDSQTEFNDRNGRLPTPSGGFENQPNASPHSNRPRDLQRRWWTMGIAASLLRRLEPFMLTAIEPAPNFGNDVIGTAVRSGAAGKALYIENFSEVPRTITVDHTLYQTGPCPISLYRHAFPQTTTDRLSGGESQSFTLSGGEAMALLYHSGFFSYTQPVRFYFTLPLGASKAAIRYIYGYSGLLEEYGSAAECAGGNCTLYWDVRLNDVYYRYEYMDNSNRILAASDIHCYGACN